MSLLLLLLLARPDVEPDPEPDPRPDRAVIAFDKAIRDPKAKDWEKKRKALVEKIKKHAEALEKRGKKAEAESASDHAVLLESIKPGADLEKLTPADALKAGSIKGKYKKLLHVLHIPTDKASYTEFRDWGHYTGTSYHSFTDLKQGFWVYSYPRWYIWEKQP